MTRRVQTTVSALGLALLLAACGSSVPNVDSAPPAGPATTASTATTTAEASSEQDTPTSSTTTEARPKPTRDKAAEAEASRSADQAVLESAMKAYWGEAEKSEKHSLCNLWLTEQDEFMDEFLAGAEGDAATREEAASAFFTEACLELERASDKSAKDKSTYKELSSRDLALMVKDPDAHAGNRYVLYAHIWQFDAATGTDAFLMRADTVQHNYSYEFEHNMLATAGEPDLFAELVEGDIVRVHLQVLGAHSYDTQIGGNTTVPMVRVYLVEAVGFDQ